MAAPATPELSTSVGSIEAGTPIAAHARSFHPEASGSNRPVTAAFV